MKKIINYSELGQILDINLTGGRCACKKTALDNGGKNIYGTNAQFPQNRLITNAEKETVTYTITFNKRVDGVDSLIQTKTVAAGSAIGSVTLPTVQGYHFDHWDPSDPTSVIATQNATYTAVYAQDAQQYVIRFIDWNGTILKTQTLTSDQLIVPPANPTRTDYTFVKWSPDLPADMHPTKSQDYKAKYSYTPPHKGDPDQYFTITTRTPGSIDFNISTQADANVVRYRISDGTKDAYGDYIFGSWVTTNLTPGTAQVITVPNLLQGYVVQWRGDATHYGYGYGDGAYSHFSSQDCQFDISNNLLTLLYDVDVDSLTTAQKTKLEAQSDYCFVGLFAECDKLISASDLYFPTNLIDGVNTPEHHFTDMFRDCENLQSADFYISSGQLLDSAYERMFLGCSSLTVPPHLPSTQLGPHCYQAMFSGCTSLVNAPELPAVNLVAGCYDGMFGQYPADGSTYHDKNYSGCTSLKNITMRATYYEPGNEPQEWKVTNQWGTSVVHPLRNWVKFVNSNGYQGQTDGHFYGDSGWKNVATNGQDEYYGAGISGCDGISYVGVPYNWTKN